MPRPQAVTDAEILSAARRVIGRRGYERFTLSEVAKEVGLSRGAIILRFKSTQALKVELATRMIANFIAFLRELPVMRSGDGLIHFAAAIGGTVRHENLASFMAVFRGNIRDPDLAKVERQRALIFREAIAARMPDSALPCDAAVDLFQAHLGGAILQWEALSSVSASEYLVALTKDWLTLARIDFTKDYSAQLAPEVGEDRAPAPKLKSRRAR
jgi:TetR/AcrR family macrolide resistance operon transcriptional repressor